METRLAAGQESHNGLSCLIGVAADSQEPIGGLPGAVNVAADGQEPHADSLV